MTTLITAGAFVVSAFCASAPADLAPGACLERPAPVVQSASPAAQSVAPGTQNAPAPVAVRKRVHHWSWLGTGVGAAAGAAISAPILLIALSGNSSTDGMTAGDGFLVFGFFTSVGAATGLAIDCVRFAKGTLSVTPITGGTPSSANVASPSRNDRGVRVAYTVHF